jgi:hypothetical protein
MTWQAREPLTPPGDPSLHVHTRGGGSILIDLRLIDQEPGGDYVDAGRRARAAVRKALDTAVATKLKGHGALTGYQAAREELAGLEAELSRLGEQITAAGRRREALAAGKEVKGLAGKLVTIDKETAKLTAKVDGIADQVSEAVNHSSFVHLTCVQYVAATPELSALSDVYVTMCQMNK